MPCKGCKEEKQKIRDERRTLDGKLIAVMSEAIREVQATNPALAARLMALNGELNALGARERQQASS
jgi:hypothetical protein